MCKLSLASVNWHQHEIEYVESIIRTDIHILRGILNVRQKRTNKEDMDGVRTILNLTTFRFKIRINEDMDGERGRFKRAFAKADRRAFTQSLGEISSDLY